MSPSDAYAGWDVVSGPGLTALGLAASRLVESGRPDRLIDDPLGRLFLNAIDRDRLRLRPLDRRQAGLTGLSDQPGSVTSQAQMPSSSTA